jgi:hypothetical protein
LRRRWRRRGRRGWDRAASTPPRSVHKQNKALRRTEGPVRIHFWMTGSKFQITSVVFGSPETGSGSISTRYGSGSFYHQAKIVRKTLIPTVLNKRKFLVVILKVADENTRIRIRSRIRIRIH